MAFEITRPADTSVAQFFQHSERENLKTFYGFSVIWHEQSHDFAAIDVGETVGALTIRISASLAHVERLFVQTANRRVGIGRALLTNAEDVANYYNCHKMTVLVPSGSAAQHFFEACGYHQEALLPQHTFKIDMSVLRKFLL
ncbi:MAG: GNAT family N-acetyltransferase [Candidatus Tumulicola sp.]